MPTINIQVSKTTVAGLLSGFIGSVGPITAYLATTNNPRATAACGLLTLAGVVARVWVGVIQQDADSTKALVPGVAEPQQVPAHPVPDNPHDIAVK
jgi:hypothetical protein